MAQFWGLIWAKGVSVWGIIERLGVVEAIDEACERRRSDAGASVGTYLAFAALNRAQSPPVDRA